MKKLESNFKNMVLVLSGITFFAALSLASVYTLTKDPIAQSKTAKQQNAIQEVLPPYDHVDAKPTDVNEGMDTMKVYKAYDKANDLVGAAVETFSNRGYKGHIGVIVGFDKVGVIVNYSVLEQNETPGLGAKMLTWFKTNKGRQNIIGLNPGRIYLTVKDVDAITAATISSKAFLSAVQNAHNAYSKVLENMPLGETGLAIDTINNTVKSSPSGENIIKKKGQKQ